MNAVLPWADQLTSVSQSLGPGLSSELAALSLPPLHYVRQTFPRQLITDVEAAVAEQFARPEIQERIRPGARVCVAVGSRGIAQIRAIVRAVIREVKLRDAEPFIIPAMGSHGGATPEGQVRVLADYGITEETMGAPIVSSLETTQVGVALDGVPVYCSNDASAADAIIPVGRVKPHTGFRGPIESGLMKMLTIGLGKQHGADTLHAQGMDRFGELIPAAARVILETQPVAFGLAIVENAYDEPARIEAVLPEILEAREKELLVEAKGLMPSLPFSMLHVLVIQAIGKNISGSGLDPNVCGRFVRSNGPAYEDHPEIQHIAVLDLTPETHGNASGIGLAELMTLRVLQKIDLPSTYANCMTASHLAGAMLPAILENDRACIATAIKTATKWTPETLKLAIIRNTLEVGELWISPALLEEARAQPHLEVNPIPSAMEFDADGSIISPITCADK
ncbi:MAG TPA: lactate racemase domain-containing protein [Armatimonadota bacterium]|nr:lactate racemase domain-containing protein [Armatimonadota bacterium]